MAKKGKALGKDPLFWVRDTRKKEPGTSELPSLDDTPTADLKKPPAVKPPPPPKPSTPGPKPSVTASAKPPASVPSVQSSTASLASSLAGSGGPAPGGSGSSGAAPAVRVQEIHEPRGMFLLIVLVNMFLLLVLGIIGYCHLSSRIGALEKRLEQVAPIEQPAGRTRSE